MAKNIYVGVFSDVPVYVEPVSIIGSNITDYFTVADTDYTFTASSNSGVFSNTNTSTSFSQNSAILQITAKFDMKVSFDYTYKISTSDSFTIHVNNSQKVSVNSSGTGSSSLECAILEGETIVITYNKAMFSGTSYYAKLSNIKVIVQTGTESKDVAKKINNAYIGINGVARKIIKAYIGVNEIAQLCWDKSCKHTSLSATTYTWDSTHTNGCTASATCNGCGKVFSERSTSVVKRTVAATCTAEGYYDHRAYFPTFSSKLCPDYHGKTDALGHDYSVLQSSSAGVNCVTSGTNTYKCSRCSATTTKADGPKGEHSFTVTDDGSHWYCSVCGIAKK